jgi:hypothetical protein
MFCPKCGKKQPASAQQFCIYCGSPIITNLLTQESSASRKQSGCVTTTLKVLAVVFVISLVADIITSIGKKPEPPPETAEQKKEKIRKRLDPAPSVPMTAKEHLERGNLLLAKVDVNGDLESAEVLLQLVSEHGVEAQKDARVRPQAKALMKRMADKALEVVKSRAWQSSGAKLEAQVQCRVAIESRLKAPSTADWSLGEVGRWSGHPGYFLVRYRVDAQNSFGAKLRGHYECQVLCLSESVCEVSKMYQYQ